VVGTGLQLDPPDAPATGQDLRAAFGMYKASAGIGRRPTSLTVECLPGSPQQQYFVALADYTKLQWQFFGPSSIPEFQINLTGPGNRFVSQLGNVYFLVLCFNDNTALHSQTTLIFGADTGGGMPGCPFGLRASDGEFHNRVELVWQPGCDCNHFQIFRRALFENHNDAPDGGGDPGDGGDPNGGGDPPADGSAPPPGDGTNPPPPGGGDDPDAVWRLIGRTDGNHFADFDIFPGRRYEYRVRALNAQGTSGWSNIDIGWAKPRIFSGQIRGIVLKDGQGIGGVDLMLLGAGPRPLHFMSGPNGDWGFNNLPPLNYIVIAQHPKLEFEPEFRMIDLRLGESEEIIFRAKDAVHFGRVWGFTYGWDPIRDDGTGGLRLLSNVEVGVKPKDAPEDAPFMLVTHSNEIGRYEFHGLAPGEYVERAMKPGLSFFPERRPFRLDGVQLPPVFNFFGWRNWMDAPPPADGGGEGGSGDGNTP
jgi:hypothetical protein